MAKKKNIRTVEQQLQANREYEIKSIKERIAWNITPKNPTRHYTVGQRVRWGAMAEVYIHAVYEDGMYYDIICKNVVRDRDKPAADEIILAEWIEILPYGPDGTSNFAQEEKHYIRLSNSGLDSLLHMIYHAGIDFDVDYQRDHVWTLDDKVALIDSIFNHIEIGKFVFAQRDFARLDKIYEVIDGKQRLTAIKEFYEDRFQYKGFYFSQLSFNDRHKFRSHGITYGILENPSRKATFETFIKMNTTGRPMANEDVEKVKQMLKNIPDEVQKFKND